MPCLGFLGEYPARFQEDCSLLRLQSPECAAYRLGSFCERSVHVFPLAWMDVYDRASPVGRVLLALDEPIARELMNDDADG